MTYPGMHSVYQGKTLDFDVRRNDLTAKLMKFCSQVITSRDSDHCDSISSGTFQVPEPGGTQAIIWRWHQRCTGSYPQTRQERWC